MTNSVTTLACSSCGSRPQITKGVNRFACGHCGTEQIVHRESGIVYLEPIATDIHHIRSGIDKTAAELAIVRLTKELNVLESELKTAKIRDLYTWQPVTNLEIILVIASGILFLVTVNSKTPEAWLIFFAFLCSFCAFIYLWIKRDGASRKTRQQAIDKLLIHANDTRTKLARNRRLV